MMTDDADGTLVVVGIIIMEVGCCRDRGVKEQKDEENEKAIFPDYNTCSIHDRTLYAMTWDLSRRYFPRPQMEKNKKERA